MGRTWPKSWRKSRHYPGKEWEQRALVLKRKQHERGWRQYRVSRFRLGIPRKARDAKSREKPTYMETRLCAKWSLNGHEVKAITCWSQGALSGHQNQAGTNRSGETGRGSKPLRDHMSGRGQLRPEEAEKADAETVTKIIPGALLVHWGHM